MATRRKHSVNSFSLREFQRKAKEEIDVLCQMSSNYEYTFNLFFFSITKGYKEGYNGMTRDTHDVQKKLTVSPVER